MPKSFLSDRSLELVARRFHYLGEPFRLRILQSLSHSEKTVSQMVEELGASQSNVSKHLQLLLEGGLVSRRKSGITANYSIANPGINELLELAYRTTAAKAKEDLDMLHSGSKRPPLR